MIAFNFLKNKYGKELLIDCFRLSEIEGRSLALNEMHITTFYEIFLFLEGNGSVLLEGQLLTFEAPVVLLLPPAQPRQWRMTTTPDCLVVIFEGAFIETFLSDSLFLHRLYYFGQHDASPLLPLPSEVMPDFNTLWHNLKAEITLPSFDSQQLLRAYLYQLLILLNRAYAKHYQLTGNLYRNTGILQFKRLLSQYIREKNTVKEYAQLLQLNRNRLNQLCQEAFGKDAQTIIRQELVQSCKNDLLGSSQTIAEISHAHNFSAPSNFIRFFKSLTGISPAVYRATYAD
ncbi:AraC-like DNA-binding protein [Spirosoma oryzae]|uniref:AraC-like DNA-binding protein n=1 Tax=Spirosoma oryzae TaxID=1469603 RepID=A0A2T0SAI8_9BACT|nr:AraC family transcriptional regulator [Spirosoma oryzae]PRY30439.1 AraC-like DNA-binding protein [Spirosoma oryzae]